MKRLFGLVITVPLLLSVACFRSGPPELKLRFEFKPRSISSAALTCIAVNIVGEGIPSQASDGSDKNLAAALNGDYCSYPGITTQLVPRNAAGIFELTIPPGKDRLIQVFGVENTAGCPTGVTLGEVMAKARVANSLDATYGGVYEIGRTVTDLYRTTSVTVANTFDGNNPKDYKACSSQTGGTGVNNLSFGTTKANTHIGGKIALSVSGGSGGNTFQVVSGGGSVASAIFTAGGSSGTAVVRVTDSQGHTKDHNISVFDANDIATVHGWYIADNYDSKADGYTITGSDLFFDRGSTATVGSLSLTSGTVKYYSTNGPNDTPTLEFSGGFFGSSSNFSLTSTSQLTAYLVGKRASTGNGGYFCFTNGSNCAASVYQFLALTTPSSAYWATVHTGSSESVTSIALTDSQNFAINELRWIDSTTFNFKSGSQSDNPSTSLPTAMQFISNGNFLLGSNDGVSGFTGSISEFLIYPTGLANTDRNKIVAYLAAKYNLTSP